MVYINGTPITDEQKKAVGALIVEKMGKEIAALHGGAGRLNKEKEVANETKFTI